MAPRSASTPPAWYACGYTDAMTNRATLWIAVAIALAVASACGCRGKAAAAASGGGLPAATQATKQAAVEVRGAAATIDTANRRIEAAAPALSAETQTIATGVAKLNTVAGTLETTGTGIAAGAEQLAKAEADLADARKRIADLEDARNGLLSRLLTLSAVAGLALAVVSAVWLRSGQGLLTGLAVFGAAVAGQWILEYRVVIGLGTLGVAGAWAAWAMIRERKASTEVVKLVETVKPKFEADSFKTIANAIQSQSTKAIVDKIQKAIGVKKAAKP